MSALLSYIFLIGYRAPRPVYGSARVLAALLASAARVSPTWQGLSSPVMRAAAGNGSLLALGLAAMGSGYRERSQLGLAMASVAWRAERERRHVR